MTKKEEAKKAQENSKSVDLESQTAFKESAVDNENVKLTDEEKLALEIQQTVTNGEEPSGKFKLKDPKTSYQEPGFTLAVDQEKELPENPSPELLARIRSGFIVKA